MLKLPKIKLGFGKTEFVKSTKGAAIAGVGATAYAGVSSYGLMPGALQAEAVVPFTVAALAALINLARQILAHHSESSY